MAVNSKFYLKVVIIVLITIKNIEAQNATIREETMSLATYDFGEPNLVPIIADNPKIAPYHKFEGYEHHAEKKNWKVITLENKYIKVMVLPEIGGKVWGAIEKSTGEEFLYKNEVVKFRNIAMRGPWTSGGIEFNFGIIGHHPATATPVDYLTRTNDDGSVSCFVGTKDLPSNTKWTVEIRLEKDKAYFETNASWYNASPLSESYYNWMTGAAVATQDLEFFIPGNAYVGHNGDAHTWPIDAEGRNLSLYKNNDFGPAKSYHVVGEYNDFFGGYYHDRKFGFGQWAPYEEMPGQKLWLWALSRSGGIWEDLLTDTDGQYIEFQAGRLFDQYSGGSVNPISQVGFDPYMMDRWSEIWFPYKEIGGMVDASKHGVLNVEEESETIRIGLNALQNLDSEIHVVVNGKTVFSERLVLQPMAIFSKTIPAKKTDAIKVSVDGTELSYSNDPTVNEIKRPFYPNTNLEVSQSEELLQAGEEAMEYREYALAYDKLTELIQKDPSHRSGLVKLAELEFRKTNYDQALKHGNEVLSMNTYDSGANYMAGIIYRAKNDTINALESLGWAARDIKFRSVAYAQMAELYLASKNYLRAATYAEKAIDYNTYNLNARKVAVIAARKSGNKDGFEQQMGKIGSIDPLSYFTVLERSFINSKELTPEIIKTITNEFPSETILNLALQYHSLGLTAETEKVLSLDLNSVKNQLWMAYLLHTTDSTRSSTLFEKVLKTRIDFVFPYRRETLPVLEWATERNNSWKLKYYLAQNYLALGLADKGKMLLKSLGNSPDSDIFYRFRAKIFKDDERFFNLSKDYEKALQLNPKGWKVWEETIQFYLAHEKYDAAYDLSKKAYKQFSGNYNIGLAHAKALLNTGRFKETLKVLENIQVLPYEHASESREIYERAHLAVARTYLEQRNNSRAISILKKSKEWPENIGVGKPYSPDERNQDYLLALAFKYIGETEKNLGLLKHIAEYTENHISNNSLNHLYGLLALRKLDDAALPDLLAKLKRFMNENDKQTQLAIAFYEKDTATLARLKEENIVPKDVWETAAWAISQ